jgi:hypothetical protein
MPELKRRVIEREDGRYWALYGQHGVVDWVLLKGGNSLDCHGEVGMHSPRLQRDEQHPCVACPYLEGGCYVEMSDAGGIHIGGEWEDAGFDDEVIWRWLEDYYKETLDATQP